MTSEKIAAYAPFMIFGALILVFVVGLSHTGNQAGKFIQHTGDPVPVTDLALLGDEAAHFNTAAWRGRPYIVNFFASWCADCRAEQEELMTLAAANMPIIGITFKDHADKITGYLKRNGNPFTAVAEDADGAVGTQWGIVGVPETFVIDAQEIIRWHHSGAITDQIASDELMPVWENVAHDSP